LQGFIVAVPVFFYAFALPLLISSWLIFMPCFRAFWLVKYAELYGVQSFIKYRHEMEDIEGTITPNTI
jgi:hypothetical protein